MSTLSAERASNFGIGIQVTDFSNVKLVSSPEAQIRAYYETLYCAWGPQHWWPAHSRFEVIVGAYLTQNTSWTNVDIALRRLREAKLLNLAGIRKVSLARLQNLIRPAGYFRQKAARLKTFIRFVEQRYGGSLTRLFAQPTPSLREELLALNGIGPETADSILLYAGQHPVFVVDTYTRRILERHGLTSAKASYDQVRELCEAALKNVVSPTLPLELKYALAHRPTPLSRTHRTPIAQVYNDMHGLIVNVGKQYCLKSKPRCEQCPLQKYLPRTPIAP